MKTFEFAIGTSNKHCSSEYRYAFNGQEKDNEVAGSGNITTAEFWEYDCRLGRRLNIDQMTSKYAWESPYATFHNNPINLIDPKGLEGEDPNSTNGGPVPESRVERRFKRKFER